MATRKKHWRNWKNDVTEETITAVTDYFEELPELKKFMKSWNLTSVKSLVRRQRSDWPQEKVGLLEVEWLRMQTFVKLRKN